MPFVPVGGNQMMATMPVGYGAPSMPNSNPPQQMALANALRSQPAQTGGGGGAPASGGNPLLTAMQGSGMFGQGGTGAYNPFGGSSFTMPGAGPTGAGAGQLPATYSGSSALGGLGSMGDLSTLMMNKSWGV